VLVQAVVDTADLSAGEIVVAFEIDASTNEEAESTVLALQPFTANAAALQTHFEQQFSALHNR
jgi:hypothetical protein